MQNRFRLVLPSVLLYVADIGLTLTGQPRSYWSGEYERALESNPLAHWLLVRHPLMFVCAALAWLVAFTTIIVRVRYQFTVWMAVCIALGHAVGGSTWLARHGTWGWFAAMLYITVAALFAQRCWNPTRSAESS